MVWFRPSAAQGYSPKPAQNPAGPPFGSGKHEERLLVGIDQYPRFVGGSGGSGGFASDKDEQQGREATPQRPVRTEIGAKEKELHVRMSIRWNRRVV
jgi:hypothetical protein